MKTLDCSIIAIFSIIFIFSNNAVFADNIKSTDSFLQQCSDNMQPIPTLKPASVNSSSPKLRILVMQPNSVATICMKYVKLSHGNPSFETNNTQLIPSIGIENIQVHGSQISFGTIPVNNVVAKAQQKILSFGSQENASTVISYTLSAKPDSIGYYHVGIPYMCGNILLAVGYQISQIDASAFQDVNPMCFNYGIETSLVGIQGANMTYVDISNKTIHSTKLPENISIIPPLQQMRIYDDVRFIQCNPSLQLIFKSENGSPACVKPQTAQKLIDRQWASKTNLVSENQKQIIDVISIQMVQSLVNPGGPPIQLTLKNIGATPISRLEAVLHLNNDYTFDFKDVTQSKPLASGDTISDTKILIGAGTSSGLYDLTITATQGNTTITNTQRISIPYSNQFPVDTSSKIPEQSLICNQTFEYKQGFIPVLYMHPNSIGKICVNYWNPNHVRNASITFFDAQSLKSDNSIQTWSNPNFVPIGNTTVIHTIKTSNKTDSYGMTIFCVGMPFAVIQDDNYNLSVDNFPWMKSQTVNCPLMDFSYKVTATRDIGIKYIPYP